MERELAWRAGRAHGVVTRAELLGAGISAKEIERRHRAGALLRVHRGVYRVGHRAPSLEARYLVAVLACGEAAELSGRAAAYLCGLVSGRAPEPEATAPTERRVKGVLTRRCRRIDPRETREQDRHREREARARGDEFRRYTYGDVLEKPELMLAELRALLSA